MKYYKNKYLIGLYTYDVYELPIAILNNANEFAEYMDIPIQFARKIISYSYNKQQSYVIINHQKVKIELVLLT